MIKRIGKESPLFYWSIDYPHLDYTFNRANIELLKKYEILNLLSFT